MLGNKICTISCYYATIFATWARRFRVSHGVAEALPVSVDLKFVGAARVANFRDENSAGKGGDRFSWIASCVAAVPAERS